MNALQKGNPWLRRAVVCVWSYLCVLSFGNLLTLNSDPNVYYGGKYFGYNLWAVLLFGVSVWLLNRFLLARDRRMKVVSFVGGLLLALCIVYGAYAHLVNDIFQGGVRNLQQVFMVACLLALTMPLFREILVWCGRGEQWLSEKTEGVSRVSGKHPVVFFMLMWVSVFLAYLPCFLAAWPGNFIFDAKYQLQNVIEGYYSTHHPLIHTLMLGMAYLFGRELGNVSFGVQFYTLTQMLILSSAFAYALLYLYRKHVRTAFLVGAWCFFALFPMHPLFAITATKDVLCAAFFLYFMVFLVRILVDREEPGVWSCVGLIVSGMLACLFRNNVSYAIAVTGIFLLLFVKGWKKKGKLAVIFIAVIVISKLANIGLIACTNASPAYPYRESLSVPLQCLARVACYRSGELEPALYEEIGLYIPERNISKYNPYCSDEIKGEANEKLLRTNQLNFWKLWIKVGLKFPDEYVESLLTNTFGYWYPLNQGIYVSSDIALYHTLIYGTEDQIVKHCYCNWADKFYSGLFWTCDYHYVPILGYFFRNAPYIWMLVLYFLYGIYGRRKEMLLLGLLPLVYFGTCLLGPMAALRYVYCLIVCVPLLAYVALAGGEAPAEES